MSYDRWVWVDDHGKIFLHTENDGWGYMRHGPEATEEEITLEQLKQRTRSSGYAEAMRKLAALAEKRK